jgi:pimeloyl-ACP methyl ester carboxylesterase
MADGDANFTERFWTSDDGLKLHYRDYPATSGDSADRPPLICLPGLTRNARDFEPVAARFAGDWRVICVDLRGRGDSEYSDDWQTYNPLTYVQDIQLLLEQASVPRFVAVGTSLGGIVTMLMAAKFKAAGAEGRIAGAVLNDIGPVLEPDGLERIRDYVGQGRSFPTWMHAARAMEDVHGEAFPGFDTAQWLVFAKRVMILGSNGRIVFDYDMKIAEPFNQPGGEAGGDLWPAFEALAGRPVLTLRGELSDIISAQTLAEMGRRLPDMEAVTVPATGHAPTLDEELALDAIARLLANVQ